MARRRGNFLVSITIQERKGQSAERVARRMGLRQRQVMAGRRELARRVADDLRAKLAEEAPKRTGAFSEGLQVRQSVRSTSGSWDQYEIVSTGPHATVGNGLSLWDLITRGTAAHEIPTGGAAAQLAKGYPLSFYWENGPNGPGLYHYWSVRHPGTSPDRFPDRALDRWRPAARRELKELGLNVVQASQRSGGSR